ncbi:VOC family protein [Streptomyces sp. L500]
MSENTTAESVVAFDRTIYPMPMFANFKVADIEAAEAFYHAVGFFTLATIPGPEGATALVHLRRMKYQDILLTPGEPVPGSTTVSFAAGGQDLEELAILLREAPLKGARVEGPTDTLWFTSDLTIDDPDGNRVILTGLREGELEEAKVWARENIV